MNNNKMENNIKINLIIFDMEKQVKNILENPDVHVMDEDSFIHEQGVLISGNDAQILIDFCKNHIK